MSKTWAVIRRLAIRPVFLLGIVTVLAMTAIGAVVVCALVANGTPVRIDFWNAVALFLVGGVTAAMLSALTLSCFILYRRNGDYREIATHLHSINHTYRDVVSGVFGSDDFLEGDDKLTALLEAERQTLTTVCQKITNIFWALTGKLCSTSVFLRLDEEDDESGAAAQTTVFLWAVGSYQNERADALFNQEVIRKGSIFFELEQRQQDQSTPSPHILSNDFRKDRKAFFPKTEIYGYEERAQPGSVLIVPIRWRESPERCECIGYLSVECSSRNRFFAASGSGAFNESEHLQFLGAFADQMFNFISLTRMQMAAIEEEPKS